ncbi:sigma factor-like helix-turn-helix DNA-binding protein [Chromatium okenii]|nr:sigma factor-like helix-turn-helix DNA-binding protein [Chromatium okenii]
MNIASCWHLLNNLPPHELADQFGVSAERIRQIEKNAMKNCGYN